MREERGRGREGGRGRRSAGRGLREEPRSEGGEIVTQKGQAKSTNRYQVVFEQLCMFVRYICRVPLDRCKD